MRSKLIARICFYMHAGMFSSIIFSAHSGISGDDLKKIKIKTGRINYGAVNFDSNQEGRFLENHARRIAPTLELIKSQAQKKGLDYRESKLASIKKLLPPELRNAQVTALAHEIGFGHANTDYNRAIDFMRLALSMRDMYEEDNIFAQRSGLLNIWPNKRFSEQKKVWLMINALEHAAKYMLRASEKEEYINNVDFYLSYAEILLYKKELELTSFTALFLDIRKSNGAFFIGINAKKTLDEIDALLTKATHMIEDPSFELPTIYADEVIKKVSNLSDEQKFALILMHKNQVDQERAMAQDNTDKLKALSGHNFAEENPLDNFTFEFECKFRKWAEQNNFSDDQIIGILHRTKVNYALNKVVHPQYYFSQQTIQKFLLAHQLISRDQLANYMRVKIERLQHKLSQLRKQSTLKIIPSY